MLYLYKELKNALTSLEKAKVIMKDYQVFSKDLESPQKDALMCLENTLIEAIPKIKSEAENMIEERL